MSNLSKTFGVSDNPLSSTADDWLDLHKHANSLAKFISRCETPMTVGIQGGWGTGKTSLMKRIDAALDENIIKVWLNTWQYAQIYDEKSLPLWVIAGLARKLWEKLGVKHKGVDVVARGFRAFFGALSKELGHGYVPEDLLDAPQSRFDGTTVVETIHNGFVSAIKGIRAESNLRGVVFFVDDLDRLQPAVAVAILEAMRNFIVAPQCVFVLAVDFDVIVQGVAKYENMSGRQFFDKIIQVPFHLQPEKYTLKKYVDNHFAKVAGEELSDVAGLSLEEIAGVWI
jgi:predicted KAP-like P-loop ATPase